MNSLMLDIETLDIKPSAIVLSIGCCFFDMDHLDFFSKDLLIKNSLYLELNIKEQELKGRTISSDTLMWWLNQSPPGLSKFIKSNDINTLVQLENLISFIINNNIKTIWSNGPSFDMVIMQSLYNDFNLKLPLDFRGWLDFRTAGLIRTLLNLPKIKRVGEKHNALNDAINQALVIIDTLKVLKQNQQKEKLTSDLELVVDLMD